MQPTRTGIILYTQKYKACVDFYAEVLELPKMFETDSLTCFEFGGAYLMVEMDDEGETGRGRIRTCLRMNVPDVKKIADQLTAKGIDVDYQEHSWGTVAKFFDPDGNLCAFKDDEKFERQVEGYKGGKEE